MTINYKKKYEKYKMKYLKLKGGTAFIDKFVQKLAPASLLLNPNEKMENITINLRFAHKPRKADMELTYHSITIQNNMTLNDILKEIAKTYNFNYKSLLIYFARDPLDPEMHDIKFLNKSNIDDGATLDIDDGATLDIMFKDNVYIRNDDELRRKIREYQRVLNPETGEWNIPDINEWTMGPEIKNMSKLFRNNNTFNEDISAWNTGNVENMGEMFCDATSFDQDISGWDTSNVINMKGMFMDAKSFDQDIGAWNTGKVEHMNDMFNGATSFNGDIRDWNTYNVRDMNDMFSGAISFNKDINYNRYSGAWNTSNVKEMHSMFLDAKNFNGDISGWDTRNVTHLTAMFSGATSFNKDINYNEITGAWNTGKVEYMLNMFMDAKSFDQDISGWNTSNVKYMSDMFNGAKSFNQDISRWDTSKVQYISNMFKGVNIKEDFRPKLCNTKTQHTEKS